MSHAASGTSPRLEEIVTDYLSGYFKMIADLIQKAQKSRHFVDGDPNHLHYLFIGAATRIFMQSPEVEKIMGIRPLSETFVTKHVQQCLALFFRTPREAEGLQSKRQRPASMHHPVRRPDGSVTND